MHLCLKNNFPLIETLLECGANGSVGKTSNGSQVLHVQAEKADELDLSNLYPDAHVVSVLVETFCCPLSSEDQRAPRVLNVVLQCTEIYMPSILSTLSNVNAAHKSLLSRQRCVMDIVTEDGTLWLIW